MLSLLDISRFSEQQTLEECTGTEVVKSTGMYVVLAEK